MLRRRDTNSYAHSYGDRDSHINTDSHADSDTHTDANADSNSDTDRNRNTYSHANVHTGRHARAVDGGRCLSLHGVWSSRG